jgi:hypothetical protein
MTEEATSLWVTISSLPEKMSKYFIPTSPQLLHFAQKHLLERFVKSETFFSLAAPLPHLSSLACLFA